MSLAEDFQHLADYLHDQMVGMNEDRRRIYLRDLLRGKNQALKALLLQFGVTTGQGVQRIHNTKYEYLYHMPTAAAIERERRLKSGQLIPFMGAQELEDNVINAMRTETALQNKGKGEVRDAITIQRMIATALRRYLIDNDLAMPETLHIASEPVESVEKRLAHGGDLFNLSGLDDNEDEPQEGC